MKTLISVLIVFFLLILQYFSINLFFFRYIDWIVIFSIGMFWFYDQKYAAYMTVVLTILFDIMIHTVAGLTGSAILISLIIFATIYSFTKLENVISRILFAQISLALSLVLIRLWSLFGNSLDITQIQVKMNEILTQIVLSGLVLFIFSLLLYSRKTKKHI